MLLLLLLVAGCQWKGRTKKSSCALRVAWEEQLGCGVLFREIKHREKKKHSKPCGFCMHCGCFMCMLFKQQTAQSALPALALRLNHGWVRGLAVHG